MERKILMTREDGIVWTYFQENDEIIEIHCNDMEQTEQQTPVLGNIYIGKVQNIVANIGAAFIDIGGVNCYYDMSQAETALFTNKIGKKPLCIGDELVVQISREAVKTKAPTVSSNLNFTGRYVVLTSGNTRIGVSAKLAKSEREEYRRKLGDLANEEYGIIVRTNAKDVPFDIVLDEIEQLKRRYESIKEHAVHRTCYSCLEMAMQPYLSGLKNVYTNGLSEIQVECEDLYEEVRSYFEKEQPELLEILHFYENDKLSLSSLYNLHTIRDRAMNERVWLKHGGYLVIQPTEALTVIDVNSGKCVSKKKTPETYLKLNLEAAQEIAKQLRLRNISGIILVDFINMDDDELMQQLIKEMRILCGKDPVQTTVVDVTELQLMEITRKKVRKPLYECWRKR